ncbi:hypothetical protein B0H12DRAFT_1246325 [Mycena haematopus]|nr:hypothetical protein B0H12DRAFT_1246325 [Mycena haematopus]
MGKDDRVELAEFWYRQDLLSRYQLELLSTFYLPRNVATTSGGLRGFKPWFTDRQVQIAVTRVIRDDQAKREYEKRVTREDFKDAATDLGLWGHLLLSNIGLTPTNPLATSPPFLIIY